MLVQAGVKVVALEARPKLLASTQTRSIAISHGSRAVLESAGMPWQALDATAITAVHTSHRNGFGRTVLKASEANVPALGYVASYANLQNTLDSQLMISAQTQCLTTITGVRIDAITQTENNAVVSYCSLDNPASQTLTAKVLVMADGGANLPLLPQFSPSTRDYQQTALLAKVRADMPHHGLAYERFTDAGPVALLPYHDDYSLVWIDSPNNIAALEGLDDVAFLAKLQTHFGYRAGNLIAVQNRMTYPLHLRQLNRVSDGRIVVVGNAAQALHPVAAQGFNLGLRDVRDLAATLVQHGLDNDVVSRLVQFAKTRAHDSRDTVGLTNLLVDVFAPQAAPIKLLRGLGLVALDVLPGMRRRLTKKMLFGGRL